MNKVQRNRLIPYKLLVYLAYSEQDSIIERKGAEVRVATGPMARALLVSNSRLIEAIQWLALSGFIKDFCLPSKGELTVVLAEPKDISNNV